ncbi:MAG: glycosyltransferase, partial [Candidatus Binatia bacterium]
MANRCEISVVLPVFNEAQNLGRVLDQLQSLKLPDTEVIVVDDGSTDG